MNADLDLGLEDPVFLSQQLVTYLGNKRALLDFIGQGLLAVQRRLGQDRLRIFDVFAGSGATARYFKQWASLLVANDLEPYAAALNSCYLTNFSDVPHAQLKTVHSQLCERLTHEPLKPGFLSELYAPADDQAVGPGERVFFTQRNARYLDTARSLIAQAPTELQQFLLAPLLTEASVHANTSGVFKGFYKNPATGLGQFGGSGQDALSRIKGEITLPYPIFSRFECPTLVLNAEASEATQLAPEVDVAYLDPPYNQHPYGSNYFMLNLILSYQRPEKISKVSGIPTDWKRSAYNRPKEIRGALEDLIDRLKTRFVLVSFNSEGFISQPEMLKLLAQWGTPTVIEVPYQAFRGSRNLHARSLEVHEYLYLVEKTQ